MVDLPAASTLTPSLPDLEYRALATGEGILTLVLYHLWVLPHQQESPYERYAQEEVSQGVGAVSQTV
jgi:hypothetical protein